MKPMTLAAVAGILLAAALYTTATFAERRARVLKASHLRLFWSGFVVDVIATTLMTMISGGFSLNLHGVLGVGAILVMLGHSTWATVVLALKQAKLMRQFHTFSLAVWALWMITLVTGFALALPRVIARSKNKARAELLAPPEVAEPIRILVPDRFAQALGVEGKHDPGYSISARNLTLQSGQMPWVNSASDRRVM